MEKSTTIKELAVALVEFQAKVKPVKKDGSNPYFKSKYATLESTIETIREDLASVGLSFSQFPTGVNGLVTILMHKSGEWIQSTVTMAPKDNTPQGQGSAITYMRRYALSGILGIATEDDDDGNEATKPKDKAKPVPVIVKKTVPVTAPKGVQDMTEAPFPDSVPTVQVGDATPWPKEEEKKPAKPKVSDETKIAHLLKLLDISMVDSQLRVHALTGLLLKAENYPEIISRLEVIVRENKEDKKEQNEKGK